MMKKCLLIGIALAFVWSGCMKEEPLPEEPEELTAAAESVWTLTLQAVKQDAPETKGLAIGAEDSEGSGRSTSRWKSIWAVRISVP